jgi:hypothetical protein
MARQRSSQRQTIRRLRGGISRPEAYHLEIDWGERSQERYKKVEKAQNE